MAGLRKPLIFKVGKAAFTVARLCRSVSRSAKQISKDYRTAQIKEYKKYAKLNRKTGLWEYKKLKPLKKLKKLKKYKYYSYKPRKIQ